MPARLSETYRPGDLVEIVFDVDGDEQWLPGRVVGLQHPGLWVQLPRRQSVVCDEYP